MRLWPQQGTCRITDVQMYHVLLVHKEHLEVFAASRQHRLVGLKVNTIHHKGAVTEKAQLPLLVQLLQDTLAVLGEIHGCGKPEPPVSTEKGCQSNSLPTAKPQVRLTEETGSIKQGRGFSTTKGQMIPDTCCKPRWLSRSQSLLNRASSPNQKAPR